jgi:hypothetical protein
MRTTVLAMVAAMAATSAMADQTPLGTTGLTLNTEAEAQYKVDAETTTIKLTPELGYVFMGVDLTAATTLNVYDNVGGFTFDDEFDHMPTIDLEASYMMSDALELELGTAYNLEAKERSEVTMTATFSF